MRWTLARPRNAGRRRGEEATAMNEVDAGRDRWEESGVC
jgi:hypothetical protein